MEWIVHVLLIAAIAGFLLMMAPGFDPLTAVLLAVFLDILITVMKYLMTRD